MRAETSSDQGIQDKARRPVHRIACEDRKGVTARFTEVQRHRGTLCEEYSAREFRHSPDGKLLPIIRSIGCDLLLRTHRRVPRWTSDSQNRTREKVSIQPWIGILQIVIGLETTDHDLQHSYPRLDGYRTS